MRKVMVVAFAGWALGAGLYCATLAWAADLREAPSPQTTAAAAPPECLATLRNIIVYIFKEKPNIADDKAAQNRWLTRKLRDAIAKRRENCLREQKANPTDEIDFPSNQLFAGFWDSPTTYSIVGSRRYGSRAIIDVLYSWCKGTQYEGDQESASFVFNLENNTWLLDDIYTFNGKYSVASSLQEELERHF